MCECVPQCDALLIKPLPPCLTASTYWTQTHHMVGGGDKGAGLVDGARETRGHTAVPRPPSAGCSHHNARGERRRCREKRAQRWGWCWQGGAAKHQEQGGGGGGKGWTSTGHESRLLRTQPRWRARGLGGGDGSTRLDLPGDALMEHGPGSRILSLP